MTETQALLVIGAVTAIGLLKVVAAIIIACRLPARSVHERRRRAREARLNPGSSPP
jgi:hypothetical protein